MLLTFNSNLKDQYTSAKVSKKLKNIYENPRSCGRTLKFNRFDSQGDGYIGST